MGRDRPYPGRQYIKIQIIARGAGGRSRAWRPTLTPSRAEPGRAESQVRWAARPQQRKPVTRRGHSRASRPRRGGGRNFVSRLQSGGGRPVVRGSGGGQRAGAGAALCPARAAPPPLRLASQSSSSSESAGGAERQRPNRIQTDQESVHQIRICFRNRENLHSIATLMLRGLGKTY